MAEGRGLRRIAGCVLGLLLCLAGRGAAAQDFDYAWKTSSGRWDGYCLWREGWAGGCGIGMVAATENAYLLEFHEFRGGGGPIRTVTIHTPRDNVVRAGGPLVFLASDGTQIRLTDEYVVENGFSAVIEAAGPLGRIATLLDGEPGSISVLVPSASGPPIKASFLPAGYRRAREALLDHVETWR